MQGQEQLHLCIPVIHGQIAGIAHKGDNMDNINDELKKQLSDIDGLDRPKKRKRMTSTQRDIEKNAFVRGTMAGIAMDAGTKLLCWVKEQSVVKGPIYWDSDTKEWKVDPVKLNKN